MDCRKEKDAHSPADSVLELPDEAGLRVVMVLAFRGVPEKEGGARLLPVLSRTSCLAAQGTNKPHYTLCRAGQYFKNTSPRH